MSSGQGGPWLGVPVPGSSGHPQAWFWCCPVLGMSVANGVALVLACGRQALYLGTLLYWRWPKTGVWQLQGSCEGPSNSLPASVCLCLGARPPPRCSWDMLMGSSGFVLATPRSGSQQTSIHVVKAAVRLPQTRGSGARGLLADLQ